MVGVWWVKSQIYNEDKPYSSVGDKHEQLPYGHTYFCCHRYQKSEKWPDLYRLDRENTVLPGIQDLQDSRWDAEADFMPFDLTLATGRASKSRFQQAWRIHTMPRHVVKLTLGIKQHTQKNDPKIMEVLHKFHLWGVVQQGNQALHFARLWSEARVVWV